MNIEKTIQKPKLLELVKRPSLFKLIVSSELEQQIRYYLGRFPNIEYSGTLFYKVTGSFETNDLEVQAIDFLLQDIGTSGYTEFAQSPDVISYMVEHPELLDENIYQGLLHSHHTLGAFFSGTDVATLREEGSDRTHFVSLIIDTKGTYQAAITRTVEEVMTATGTAKYTTFNERATTNPITYTYSRKRLEYFMLTVERPIISNPFQELADRITEVSKQKEVAKAKATTPTYGYGNNYGYGGYNNYGYNSYQAETPSKGNGYQTNVGRGNLAIPTNKNYVPPVNNFKQKELPFEKEDVEEDVIPPYGEVRVDPELIEEIARQLVTGDIAYVDGGKATLEELIIAGEDLFNKRFSHYHLFTIWVESYVEFLLYYTEDPKLEMYDDDTLAALVAYDLAEKLEPFATKNKYVRAFIEEIEKYII